MEAHDTTHSSIVGGGVGRSSAGRLRQGKKFHCFAESAGVYYTAGKHRSPSAKFVTARQLSATRMWKAAHARRNCIVDYSLLINQLLLCKRRLFKRRLKLTALLGRILLTLTKVIKTLQPTWNNNGFIFIPVNSLTKLSYRYVQFLLKEKVSSCSRGHQFFKDLRSSVSWFFVELKEREKTTE